METNYIHCQCQEERQFCEGDYVNGVNDTLPVEPSSRVVRELQSSIPEEGNKRKEQRTRWRTDNGHH